jgi:hypothetical protein
MWLLGNVWRKKMKKQKKYWCLAGWNEGVAGAIHHGEYVVPFALWVSIPKDEWLEHRKDRAYTRHCVRRPTDYIDLKDQVGMPETIEEIYEME